MADKAGNVPWREARHRDFPLMGPRQEMLGGTQVSAGRDLRISRPSENVSKSLE
jgi:hypothetical protein